MNNHKTAAAAAASTAKIVWLHGMITGSTWCIRGVFDCERDAVAGCTTQDDFVGPMTMNVLFPPEIQDWNGMYYPMRVRMHPQDIEQCGEGDGND